jgi:hypothetical protein
VAHPFAHLRKGGLPLPLPLPLQAQPEQLNIAVAFVIACSYLPTYANLNKHHLKEKPSQT